MAKTLQGLEHELAKELQQTGAMDVRVVKRGVTFVGDLGFMYKANLWVRTALRILVPIKQFKANNEEEIYEQIKEIAWEELFDKNKTILVDTTVFAQQYRNTLFLAQKVKDGIADRFREKVGSRPSVDTKDPDVRIDLYVHKDNVVVSMDSSGSSLHKRGYRTAADVAPINEVLAAGMLRMAGWKGLGNLIDPMCGSGTFLIEGALIAQNIPPGVFRKGFAFQNWKNFDEDLYKLIFEKALEKEKAFHYSILGFDKEPRALMKARANIKSALMEEVIKLEKSDFLNFKSSRPVQRPGFIVFNPPYGIKLEADIPELYQGIGNTLKRDFSGFTAWMITSSQEGLKNVGLRPSFKLEVNNGGLQSWLVRYDLYEGSKKVKKNE